MQKAGLNIADTVSHTHEHRYNVGRLATMPSADYCLITTRIAPGCAVVCYRVRSLLVDSIPERQGIFFYPCL